MDDTATVAAKPTILFWFVAALALLWNGFGAADYALTKLHNAWWLTSMQVDPAMVAKIDAAPVWGTAGWAIGVWASLAGAVLLVLRSRHAASAFLLSIAGAVVGFAWQIADGLFPGPAFPAIILALIALFWWWSKRQIANGNLS